MKTVMVNELNDSYCGESIQMKGWVYNTRSIGKIWFLIFRDGTGLIQGVIVKNEASEETFGLESKLNQEDSIIIEGIIRKENRSIGGFEIGIKNIEVVNHVIEEYPISPKEHGTDFLMSNRHLWIRSKRQNAIMRIRHQVSKSIRDFFDSNGFVLIDSPIFTANAVEGTTSLFEVDYFERSAFLTQSGQLYQEASASAFGKSYCFGPCFRAEKSKTRRHLTEFWMVEPEIAYCDINENMAWAEKLLIYIINNVLKNKESELKTLDRDINKLKLCTSSFPRISYTECIKILNDSGNQIKWGDDFGSPEETYIAEKFDKPVIVYGFPSEIKAFYMKRDPENDKVVLGMDILAPEGYGEIVGGSERETNLDILLERIKNEKLNQSDYEWFLDLRRFGSVQHSGFGMGLERVVAWICGLSHIRETIPFARTMTRLNP